MAGYQPPIFAAKSENILLAPLAQIIPGNTVFTEQNVTNMNLSFTLLGGSFSISVLKDTVPDQFLKELAVVSLPFGKIGLVTGVSTGWSNGGLVDTISGPAYPLSAWANTFFGQVSNQFNGIVAVFNNVLYGSVGGGTVIIGSPATAASFLAEWTAPTPLIQNFTYRGKTLAGLQQVCSLVLADLILRKDGWHVVNPNVAPAGAQTFTIPQTDVVNATQTTDYSQDVGAILNPGLTTLNVGLPQQYVYDSQHAQKQPKFTVQCGAPGSTGSTDFIPIPDGWLVDGNYEEWQPTTPTTDLTNPAATVPNGRYWKVFQSPSNPLNMRGITSFTRLVKQIVIPGNVSSFVGSPITGETHQNAQQEFDIGDYTSNQGIYGYDSGHAAAGVTLFDVISNKFLTFPNALVLTPHGGGSAQNPSQSFFNITMEQWTFPLVNPQTFSGGANANPFGIPPSVVVVTPPANYAGSGLAPYWNAYLRNYQLIHSPHMNTKVTCVYRNAIPEMGDTLSVPSLNRANCGRIENISLNFSRGGATLVIGATLYPSEDGRWNSVGAPGSALVGGSAQH